MVYQNLYNMETNDLNKILLAQIHDHNSGIGHIEAIVGFIEEEFANNTLTRQNLAKYLNIIRQGTKNCQHAIDQVYLYLKK